MGRRKISKREFLKISGTALAGSPFCLFGNKLPALAGLPGVNRFPAKYSISTPRGVRCQLCPNNCKIEEGDRGDCRTRINKGGELYTLAYGNPCAVHVDPIEKKPLNHFLPGTTSFSIATGGCNLACLNCQNWQISQKKPDELQTIELMPEKVALEAKNRGCTSVAYTYSEPVVFYEYTTDSAGYVHDLGMKNVIVSAGYIEEQPLREWCQYIDAANIDLKSFRDETYQQLNGGTLEPVLNTLKVLKEEGVWLEITNLIVPDWTDDAGMIEEMCQWLVKNGFEDTPLHFSRFTPMYKLAHLPATPLAILEEARRIALSEGLRFVYIGNVPGHSGQDTYCPSCKKKVLDRSGFRIGENHIKDGHCDFCGESIAGVW
ncbi:AmmeMemoRadiSam system radical SAM enzyme [Marinilabilia rubra]|uniref:AmmeMemoRadiSam system radical SAM enzyme n=1 Tax=Marinilabilia rubra TaxID=2162893 RepID=A0A2U2BE85_9BACT|nr:AmmeMemoRadiSam system radical SAM enzyme [Marinilabilia rubra]PWE01386.1 AmmeMemoRadiSam system radical SAM enzyme [Marinilabilia rubra]